MCLEIKAQSLFHLLADKKNTKKIHKGCPQGGILRSFLWNWMSYCKNINKVTMCKQKPIYYSGSSPEQNRNHKPVQLMDKKSNYPVSTTVKS